ncbi:MAG: tetratricopeptide repeat protein [Candidatus Omnitrophota bacterium]
MKNLIRRCALSVVLALSLGVLNSGCIQQYTVERMLWQANKAAEPIFINQGSVPSYEFNRVIALFDKVIEKVPGSSYALKSKLRKASLFISQNSYEKAFKIYDDVVTEYKEQKEICARVIFLKGQACEKQGLWDKALEFFNQILLEYEKTQKSLAVPLYIARYYSENGQDSQAQQAYLGAVMYFQSIADKYPNTKGAVLCENLIVRTYLEMGTWGKAAEYIEQLDGKYKLGPDTLLVLARIYDNKVKDPVRAKQIYQRILENYPKHKIIEAVKKDMKKLITSEPVANEPVDSEPVNSQ